jgi:MSHA biogenesis protein MshJ
VKAPRLALGPWWRQQRQRFDALQRRERLLVVTAAAAASLMLADALWLTPAFKAWKAVHQREASLPVVMAKTAAEVQRVAEAALAQQRQLQAELTQLRHRLQDGEAAMREIEANLVGPDRMLALLEQMLASQGQLRVREMKSLPRTDLVAVAAVAAGTAGTTSTNGTAGTNATNVTNPTTGAVASTARPALYRHGIELTVEGNFGDLVRYLEALENMPQRLLWGSMQLKVEQHPKALLTLRVYTLSVDRHWLEI